MDLFPDIPRIYTALSEWIACFILVLQFSKGKRRNHFYIYLTLMGIGQVLLQLFVGTWPLFFWILGMILNVGWMLLTFIVTIQCRSITYIYLTCKAFILAEFMASLSWFLYCYIFLYSGYLSNQLIEITFMTFSYVILSLCYYYIEKFSKHTLSYKHLKKKDIGTILLTATIIFTISNIGFVLSNTSFAFGDLLPIFILRSSINLCGILLIYIQENQRYENYLNEELSSISNVFHSQYEQYEAYKESSQLIDRKFHDLKHQLEAIELEESSQKRQDYVNQLKEDLSKYQANIKTGNAIADVILTRKNAYCIENNITFTCIMDGTLLNFMETMDLCSLLGNTLDNAIESTMTLVEQEKRLINLRVRKKANFVLYSVENYSETSLDYENDLPKTTKKNKDYHGYGLKSTAYIAEKYNGNLSIKYEDNWFKLNVLIPVEEGVSYEI